MRAWSFLLVVNECFPDTQVNNNLYWPAFLWNIGGVGIETVMYNKNQSALILLSNKGLGNRRLAFL